jgi:hypothetical protein
MPEPVYLLVIAVIRAGMAPAGGTSRTGTDAYANITCMTMPGYPESQRGPQDWEPLPPYWAPPPLQPQRTNSLAIAALICGIGEFLFLPTAIGAVILGHIAKRQIRQTGEGGRGLATAGLILGYIGVTLLVGVLIFLLSLPFVLPHIPGATH